MARAGSAIEPLANRAERARHLSQRSSRGGHSRRRTGPPGRRIGPGPRGPCRPARSRGRGGAGSCRATEYHGSRSASRSGPTRSAPAGSARRPGGRSSTAAPSPGHGQREEGSHVLADRRAKFCLLGGRRPKPLRPGLHAAWPGAVWPQLDPAYPRAWSRANRARWVSSISASVVAASSLAGVPAARRPHFDDDERLDPFGLSRAVRPQPLNALGGGGPSSWTSAGP